MRPAGRLSRKIPLRVAPSTKGLSELPTCHLLTDPLFPAGLRTIVDEGGQVALVLGSVFGVRGAVGFWWVGGPVELIKLSYGHDVALEGVSGLRQVDNEAIGVPVRKSLHRLQIDSMSLPILEFS